MNRLYHVTPRRRHLRDWVKDALLLIGAAGAMYSSLYVAAMF